MLISLIATLVVAGVLYWALQQLVFPYVAAPFQNAIRVLVIVVVVIYVVRALLSLTAGIL